MSYIRSQRRITPVLLCAFLLHSCQSQLNVIKEQLPAEGSSQSREQAMSSTLVSSPDATDAVTPISPSAAGSPHSLQGAIPGPADTNAITPYATINDTKKRPIDEDSKSITKRVKTNKISSANWFESFIKTVEKIEKDTTEEEVWDEMANLLDAGAEYKLLETSVTCPHDVDSNVTFEYTPLHYAAARGLLALVRGLVEQWDVPVDIQTEKNKNIPLHLAATRGHLDVVKFLVDNKATIEKTDLEGSTALHYAASGRIGEMNREVIEYLVTQGANVKKLTKSGASLLNLAVFTSNIAVVEYWVDAFSNSSDPEISTLTKKALQMAKYRRKKGDMHQGPTIRMLQEFFDSKNG